MRTALLASGSGSNVAALCAAGLRGALAPARLVCVGSNRPEAGALAHGQRAGLPTFVVDHKAYPSRDAFDQALADALAAHDVELIVLAGFMRILGGAFVARYPQRILNTHPSLLPAFPGAHAPADALAHGAKVTGVTLHFVDASLDGGPIIAQYPVPIRDGDQVTDLHDRIRAVEHRELPDIVRALAAGEFQIEGRHVTRHHGRRQGPDAD